MNVLTGDYETTVYDAALMTAPRPACRILHRYCQGILSAPILQSLVWNVTASEIELKGGVTLEVVTRSYRTVRGRSVCVAVLDELAIGVTMTRQIPIPKS
jgi:hypothetical protein